MKKFWLIILLFTMFFSCRKTYNPPALQASNHFLVVDGYINAAANGVTSIRLTRTIQLTEINPIIELGAKVLIVGNDGSQYPLVDTFSTAFYNSAPLNLNPSKQYSINITTADGNKYQSDFVSIKISAPIDSLTWQQNKDVTIYVNTHDPSNKTIYYKWDFIETWEHIAPVQTFWVLDNNSHVALADTTNQTDSCWSTRYSDKIITGTSIALSQDVISHQPLTTILQNNDKIKTKYSIWVHQLPLTIDAYNYWQIIQKNSQQLGTLFDLQPSQLTGNIHPITNPNEPVIGYITAAAAQEKRIFISNRQLINWNTILNYGDCQTLVDGSPYPFYFNQDTSYAPWYYATGTLLITKKQCVDCREFGGDTKRPSFWQN